WMTSGYVKPDGAGYVAYLPSTFIDHDLLLFDEWARLGMIRGDAIAFTNVTANGHLSDHWTVGPVAPGVRRRRRRTRHASDAGRISAKRLLAAVRNSNSGVER